ncbi:MAG: hypothetical protein H6835_03955 [Planctomycetes bacterium]|nr:hypothetical protein [Planctomycetota bacterium]
MNLAFLRSRHAALAVVVVAAFVAWHLVGAHRFGDRADDNVLFLLTTGWFAVAAYVVLALYAARRAAHRLRLTPEFGWRVQLPQLERAQVELTELQNRIERRELGGAGQVRRAAAEIMRRHGVHKTLRVVVAEDPRTLGQLRVTVLPREALGRLASWLSAHAWYGIAAALLVWFHGGMRTGSTMGLALNALSYVVIGTGLLGAFFWAVGPTWLTRAERELSIEKSLALRDHFARKLAEADELQRSAPDRRQRALAGVSQAEAALRAAERAAGAASGDKALQKAVKDAQRDLKKAEGDVQAVDREVAELPAQARILRGQADLVGREAARLERYRTLLRGWRLLHVPCSVVLLALVAVHVLSIYLY